MFNEAFALSFAATLFSMMNPVGSLGIFASMTADRTNNESKQIAITCAIATTTALLVVAWFGTYFLSFFGINIASLRAAGGLIVLLIGLNMLFNKTDHKHTTTELKDAKDHTSIAVVPLAIPIVAGPGSFAAVLVASNQHGTMSYRFEISIIIIALSLFTGVLFYFARPILSIIGKSGMGVVTRIMGLILISIAIGLITEGLKILLPGLA